MFGWFKKKPEPVCPKCGHLASDHTYKCQYWAQTEYERPDGLVGLQWGGCKVDCKLSEQEVRLNVERGLCPTK